MLDIDDIEALLMEHGPAAREAWSGMTAAEAALPTLEGMEPFARRPGGPSLERFWASQILAFEDTFHYVNAAAQHSRLNQGKSLWQGLENYILDSARSHGFQACVFTGPVMRTEDDDPVTPETAPGEELVINGAVAPVEFWKLVVTLDAEGQGLHATAYLLSQGQLIRNLMETRSRRESLEGFVLGEYRTFQLAVSDLQEATGYDFSAYVNADPLKRTEEGARAAAEGEPVVLPLDRLADVRL